MGIGHTIFWTMKQFLAAMRLAAIPRSMMPTAANPLIRDILVFLADA
jgi:hypothetical protein